MRRIATGVGVALLTVAASAQWSNPNEDVPAYHAQPPAKGERLAPILTPQQLQEQGFRVPWQSNVYEEAAKVPRVLYQLPCNCRCDRALGHTSLHSCFSGPHGAVCSTCAKEGAYAYQMTRRGKTPKQIREGVAHYEYESIDLKAIS